MANRFVAAAVIIASFAMGAAVPAGAQTALAQPFVGKWCAQGDPAKPTSIAAQGFGLTLTNEQGSTSSGTVVSTNPSVVLAPQWNLVRGTLDENGNRISWTNGTFWTRCNGNFPRDLTGTWYFGGDNSKPCRIEQNGRSLVLRNESGQSATGTITAPGVISTVWGGTTITGTLSSNHRRILWSNGTYWTR